MAPHGSLWRWTETPRCDVSVCVSLSPTQVWRVCLCVLVSHPGVTCLSVCPCLAPRCTPQRTRCGTVWKATLQVAPCRTALTSPRNSPTCTSSGSKCRLSPRLGLWEMVVSGMWRWVLSDHTFFLSDILFVIWYLRVYLRLDIWECICYLISESGFVIGYLI